MNTKRLPESVLQLIGGLVALALLAVCVSGCTVSHDRLGNPNGAGVAERFGGAIQDTAGGIAPYLPPPWGQLLIAVASAVGVGVLGARAKRREDAAFDEGVSRAAPGVPNAVQPVSASRVGPMS